MMYGIYQFLILSTVGGRMSCLNNAGRVVLFLFVGALPCQKMVAQSAIAMQSNRIPGIQYRAGAYLPPEMLTWGNVTTKGPTIMTAGSKESFEVNIDIKKEIPAGSQVGILLHFVSDTGPFQTTDPAKLNYLSCESDQVDFDISSYSYPTVHGSGSFFPYGKFAEITLKNSAKPGAKLLFKFKNYSIKNHEETLFNIRFAVITNDAMTGYLGDADFEVVGDKMHHLQLVASTCTESSEKTDCKIVVLDRNKNKSGFDLSNAKFNIKISGSDKPLDYEQIVYDIERRHHVIKGLKFNKEGVYYLEASIEGNESITGTSNPIVVRKNWNDKIYFGDLHQHTYLSDSRGVLVANYEYAITTGCLDFLSLTPHQEQTYRQTTNFLPDSPIQKGWEEMIEASEKYNGPDLVTILGSEMDAAVKFVGHMNTYYLNVDNRPELERLWGKNTPKDNYPMLSNGENFQDYLDITRLNDTIQIKLIQ